MAKKCLPLNIPHVSEPLKGAGGQTDVSLAVAWALASSVRVPAPLPPAVVRSLQRARWGRWETDQHSTTARVIRVTPQKDSSLALALPEEQSRPLLLWPITLFPVWSNAGDKNLSNKEHKPRDAVIVHRGSLFHNLFVIGTAYLTI